MESGSAGGRNSQNSSPESDATIVARSAGKHGFRLPQLFGLQNCLPEEEGRRFAELSKDTSYEEVCILEGLSMSNRIQGNRNEELGQIPRVH